MMTNTTFGNLSSSNANTSALFNAMPSGMPDTHLIAHLCGAGGTLFTLVLSLSPVRDILRCKAQGNLGGCDTRFWPVTYWCFLSWALYGTVIGDAWLFGSAASATVLWLWFNLIALQLMSREEGELQDLGSQGSISQSELAAELCLMRTMTQKFRNMSDSNIVNAVLLFTMLSMLLQYLALSDVLDNIIPARIRLSIFSFVCALSSMVCYGGPASRLQAVVKTWDASCIHTPTVFTSLLNNLFWGIYCMLLGQWSLVASQGVGVTAAFLQLLAKILIGNGVYKEDIDEDVVFPMGKEETGNDCKELPCANTPSTHKHSHARTPSESSTCANESDAETEGAWSPRTPRLKRYSTIDSLPDLKDRLEKYGMYEDYLKWQHSYRAWRCGKSKGAHGEVTDLQCVIPVSSARQVMVPGCVEEHI